MNIKIETSAEKNLDGTCNAVIRLKGMKIDKAVAEILAKTLAITIKQKFVEFNREMFPDQDFKVELK